MKKSTFTFFFSCFLFLLNINAQHTIVLSGTTFTPNDLTINVGETVTWDNQNGTHNINGSQQSYPDNPESFSNGGAAAAPWMFSHTFTMPGVYDYHCDPHFSVGMTGKITVMATPATDDIVITEFNYNNPGLDDYEYVELFNNGSDAIDMENWTLSGAVTFTFPAFTLQPDSFVVIANNATAFEAAFGFMPFQFSGALNNSGEDIMLNDASGALADHVSYTTSSPWPTSANGEGPSVSLCNVNADNNDPSNWAASVTPTGVLVGGVEILATPGAINECPAGPVISFSLNGFNLPENAGSTLATLILTNGNANPTQVTLELNANSTATNGEDFNLTLPLTVTFTAGASVDTQTVSIPIIDDSDIEAAETLVIDLTNPTNSGSISPNGSQYSLTIIDNDSPMTNALVITGVYDTQPAGAGVKGIELKATADIPDLSVFGVGSANNGGGSNGVETQLPAIAVSAGDCIYVADDSLKFVDFFGFSATAIGDAANINGDDAIELFENNIVIDVFGDINTDGTGEPWEYLDGWAYRKSGTGPDGSFFILNNWTFSGNDVFDNVPNNASAPTPFPTCAYSTVAPTMPIANDDNVPTDVNTSVTINILSNDQTPNALTSMTVISGPDHGTTLVNGLTSITYTPELDFCGTDAFIYEICDMNGCSQAFVTITVACPPSYPAYDIAVVTSVNANGSPDSVGVSCQLQGIVHGIDFQGNSSIQFALIDGTGGISLFSSNDFGYTVTEGDELIVQGTITEFNCLTQITPDTLWVVSTGNPLQTPSITTFLNESFESELVKLTNLFFVDVNEWLGDGSSFNVQVINSSGTFTNIMRIDNDSELSSMPPPQEPFNATGLGGQFDNSPCALGYQFFPRYLADIEELNVVFDPSLAQKINFYPNPVSNTLTIDSDLEIVAVQIANLLGQEVMKVKNPNGSLDVQELGKGIYLITFQVGESIWTDKFVKE
ncbi:MAG: lamin tail domain-containing protein [Saprospiraceae bacterium]